MNAQTPHPWPDSSLRAGPYGVPRRFGMGTILIVTTGFAVLLAFLQAADWPPWLVGGAVVLVAAVGIGQMLLFGGRRPRAASVIVGAVGLSAALGLRIWWSGFPPIPASLTFWLLIFCPIVGGVLGYASGGLVAGIFLVMDAIQRTLDNRR